MAKIKKSTWLPLLLLIYLLAMTAVFARQMIDEGRTIHLVLTFVAELAIIAVLHILLRKTEQKKGRQD